MLHFVCELSSSILGIYHPGQCELIGQFGKLTDRTEIPVPELNSQFGKLTDRTEIPVPELNSQFGKLTDRSKGAGP